MTRPLFRRFAATCIVPRRRGARVSFSGMGRDRMRKLLYWYRSQRLSRRMHFLFCAAIFPTGRYAHAVRLGRVMLPAIAQG